MKFQIKNRFNGSVIFELECGSLKLCVEAAIKSGADLYGADLRGADLYGANLGGADLYGANLGGANLGGANLGEKFGELKEKGVFSVGPLGSREDTLVAFHTDKGVFIRTGCFFDSLELFRSAVIKTHGEESQHGKLYLGAANMIEYKFSEGA